MNVSQATGFLPGLSGMMSTMKLYVSHSTKFDYEAELYEPLKTAFATYDIFLPHDAENVDVKARDIISASDYLVAEVSFPSTGQGIELGWADGKNVPIICVYKTGSEVSSALRFVTNVFIEYGTTDELIGKLRNQLEPKG